MHVPYGFGLYATHGSKKEEKGGSGRERRWHGHRVINSTTENL